MSHLQLTCLGDFAVTLDGVPLVAFQTDKVRALLIYLVLEAQPQPRRRLAQLLWPGYSDTSALQNLRQSLHLLRLLLRDDETDPPWLLVTRQTVQFNPVAPLQLDVARFTHLLAQTATHVHADLSACRPCLLALREAVTLYQGDFLAGFTVADSDPFEEWRRIHQEQLHLQTLNALTQLANAAEMAGNTDQALQDARHQLALEPWLETAHRRVMRILAQRGQPIAAIAQYRRCCQVLAEELGVEPEDETTALYEQIQSSSLDRATRRQGDKGTARLSSPKSGGQGDKLTRGDTFSLSSPLPVSLSPAHNLPAVSNPLVGRAQALAEIINHLQAPGVRLLTLIGPGGMGKTRLAVEVGRERLPVLADGVFFVPLAAINTSAQLASAIATALGLPLQGGDPRSALLQGLRQKQMLLILDNFEHLLVGETTGVDLVVDLLQAAPLVQILVTSRERLNLRGEQLYAVQALNFSSNATLVEAAASAAVRLFVQSAQRVQVDFQLTAANLATVLHICRLVQGMPLGLELAAANVGVLPLTEIATEIERSAEFLSVDWRDAPERQRSMRAVFAWSWRLLDEQERQVFRRLAVFQGGFTRASAETVAGATLAALIRLVHKSLLQWNETAVGEGRYLVHELLRQFAAAELAATDEEELVASRHSEYYLAFLATQQQPILRNAPREAVQAIQHELDNIRQAWRWGAGLLASTLIEQCSLTLREFYWLTGLIDEGIEMFRLAARARHTQRLAQPSLGEAEHQEDNDQENNDERAELRLASILLGMAANLLIPVGRHEEAFERAAEVLQLAPNDANPEGAALGYLVQGQALRRQGKSAEAQRLLEQAVQIAQQACREPNSAELMLDIERRAYSWLASIALSNDDYHVARMYTAHQLEICRRLEKFVGESMALTSLVDIDKALGDYPSAQQNAEQALAVAKKVDFRWGEAVCLEHLAEITWALGDYSQAQTLYEQVARFYHEMSRPLEEASVSHNLGRLYLRLGDVARARSWIDQAFRLLHALGLPARETFWATLSRVWLGYLTDNFSQALVDAEQGWLMARQVDGGASQAYALVLLGLIRERLQQPDEAATAYHEALTIYLRLGHIHRTVEARAGLARLALAAGALANAVTEVEKILPILQDYPLAGFDEPFQVYLTCYTVLTASHAGQAATILHTAHELLAAYAQRILDPTLRRSFLENVVTHRALVEAYMEMQAKAHDAPQTQRHFEHHHSH